MVARDKTNLLLLLAFVVDTLPSRLLDKNCVRDKICDLNDIYIHTYKYRAQANEKV